jgi:hypothetical protein
MDKLMGEMMTLELGEGCMSLRSRVRSECNGLQMKQRQWPECAINVLHRTSPSALVPLISPIGSKVATKEDNDVNARLRQNP